MGRDDVEGPEWGEMMRKGPEWGEMMWKALSGAR